MISEYTFSIKITKDDLYNFNYFNSPYIKVIFIIPIIITIIQSVMSYSLMRDIYLLIATFIVYIFPLIPMVILFRIIIKSFVNKAYNTNPIYRGLINYKFDSKSAYMLSETMNTTTKWEQVYKISESNYAFYIYLSNQMALVLPKRYFDDEFKIREYREFIYTVCKDKLHPRKIKLKKK